MADLQRNKGTSKSPENIESGFDVDASKTEIAARLRESVKKAGGNAVISEKSGVSLRTLGNYLSDTTEPKIVPLARIADACGVTLDWLATGRGKGEKLPPAAIDEDALRLAVVPLEEVLQERGIRISPEKKAALILTLYDIMIKRNDDGKKLDPATLNNVLRLVS